MRQSPRLVSPERVGSALIGVLLVLSILLVLGIGLLTQKSHQYEEMSQANNAAQARALAQAGLVDVRTKINKDVTFPPARPSSDKTLTYSEDIHDLDGNLVGSYTVKIDATWQDKPFEVLQITSLGLVGDRAKPKARYTIYAEVDTARFLREVTTEDKPNPRYYDWTFLKEGSRPSVLAP